MSVSAALSVYTGEHIVNIGTTGDHVHYEVRHNGTKQNWNMDEGAYVHLYAGVPRNWTNLSPIYL